MASKISVLFVFHESMSSGGATYSGMNMVKSLDCAKITPIVLLPGEGDVKEKLESIGVKCVIAPVDCWFRQSDEAPFFQHWINRYRQFKSNVKSLVLDCQAIKRELKNYHIDVVHSNSAAIMTGFVLAKYLRSKHVWHLREFIDKDFHQKPFLGFWLLRRLIHDADATIPITCAVKKHWTTSRMRNVFQIFDAVKSKKSLLPVDVQKEKYFLFCANWVSAYKGAMWAMEAFCKSGLGAEGYKLLYVGSYNPVYKEQLVETAKQVNIENSIEFLGYCKQPTRYFRKATAFLMCSDNEAMGRTTIEAFWNGCPVLGRNTGGTPELVKDNETGYLFNTVEELASLMGKVAKTDNLQIIENARRFAMQNFTEEEYGKKIEAIYQIVMNKL